MLVSIMLCCLFLCPLCPDRREWCAGVDADEGSLRLHRREWCARIRGDRGGGYPNGAIENPGAAREVIVDIRGQLAHGAGGRALIRPGPVCSEAELRRTGGP